MNIREHARKLYDNWFANGQPNNLFDAVIWPICAKGETDASIWEDRYKMAMRELTDERLARKRAESELEKLNDPVAVHINMLRGTIATPSRELMEHVWGGKADAGPALNERLSLQVRLERDDTLPAFGAFLRCEEQHNESPVILLNVGACMNPFVYTEEDGVIPISREDRKRLIITTFMHEFGHALESHFKLPVNEESIEQACADWESEEQSQPILDNDRLATDGQGGDDGDVATPQGAGNGPLGSHHRNRENSPDSPGHCSNEAPNEEAVRAALTYVAPIDPETVITGEIVKQRNYAINMLYEIPPKGNPYQAAAEILAAEVRRLRGEQQ